MMFVFFPSGVFREDRFYSLWASLIVAEAPEPGLKVVSAKSRKMLKMNEKEEDPKE